MKILTLTDGEKSVEIKVKPYSVEEFNATIAKRERNYPTLKELTRKRGG